MHRNFQRDNLPSVYIQVCSNLQNLFTNLLNRHWLKYLWRFFVPHFEIVYAVPGGFCAAFGDFYAVSGDFYAAPGNFSCHA